MINGSDALELGLADHFMLNEQFDALKAQLQQITWSEPAAEQMLNTYLAELQMQASAQLPESQFMLHIDQIQQLAGCQSVTQAVELILSIPADNDKWLSKAQKNLKAGSPITMHLVFEQMQRASGLSLADVLRMEYAMALNCAKSGEFQEGVRALLIDKDMQPNWQFSEPCDVPTEVIAGYFEPQWQGEHPLTMLKDPFPESGAKQESTQ